MSNEEVYNELMDVLKCLFRFEYTDNDGKLNELISRWSHQPLDIRKDEFWDEYVETLLFHQFYYRGNFWEYYNTRYRLTISKENYARYFIEQTDIQKDAINRKYKYIYGRLPYKTEIGYFLIYSYDSDFKKELREWAETEFLEEFMIMPK
jgi:hypothetical protein